VGLMAVSSLCFDSRYVGRPIEPVGSPDKPGCLVTN
jgi:hypothetical protein